MNILYIAQYFNLPEEAGGSRPYQFAKAWTARGHRVTVVTSFFNPTKGGTMPERFRGRLWARETVEGIDILRVWAYPHIQGSFRRRLVNFLSFAFFAALFAVTNAAPADVVYATSTPLTVGLPGLVTSVLKRAPLAFEVRDLWPQSALVAEVMRPGLVSRLAASFARLVYRRARLVVALTRGIAEGLREEGVPDEKILFAPNGVDDWIEELAFEETAPEEGLDLDGRLVGVYVGAHGMWNGLGTIVDAAALLDGDERYLFLFVGDGDDRARLQAQATEKGLAGVRFLGPRPKQAAMAHILRSDYCLVAAWDHPFQKMVFPNKIFDYLGCGRPTIVAGRGEMAELVERAGAGLVVPPERPEALAEAIRRLGRLSAEEREAMGRRGRAHVLEHYRRADIADTLEQRLQALASAPV